MDDIQVCPRCAEKNDAVSLYCWVCYTPFKRSETQPLNPSQISSPSSSLSQVNLQSAGKSILTISFTIIGFITSGFIILFVTMAVPGFVGLFFDFVVALIFFGVFHALNNPKNSRRRYILEVVILSVAVTGGILVLIPVLVFLTCAGFGFLFRVSLPL